MPTHETMSSTNAAQMSTAALLWRILRKSMLPQKLSGAGEMLRVGTLLMPSGGGGEMASEGVQTFVSLLSLYSDAVQSSGALGRFQVMRTGGSSSVRCFPSIFLEAIRRIELFAEMTAGRILGGQDGTFKILLVFEILKALCKIYLCYRGQDIDQRGSKTGFAKSRGFRVRRDHTDLGGAKSLSPASTRALTWWLAGTSVHALRPVVYLASIVILGSNRHARTRWGPWLLSFVLDLVAHCVASRSKHWRKSQIIDSPLRHLEKGKTGEPTSPAASQGAAAPSTLDTPSTESEESSLALIPRKALFQDEALADLRAEALEHNSLETAELGRRKGLLLLYLIRPPAMDVLLKPLIAVLRRILGRVPLVGSVASLLLDLLVSLEHYYSYTSGS
jgi:hypothetical protein